MTACKKLLHVFCSPKSDINRFSRARQQVDLPRIMLSKKLPSSPLYALDDYFNTVDQVQFRFHFWLPNSARTFNTLRMARTQVSRNHKNDVLREWTTPQNSLALTSYLMDNSCSDCILDLINSLTPQGLARFGGARTHGEHPLAILLMIFMTIHKPSNQRSNVDVSQLMYVHKIMSQVSPQNVYM